MTPAGQFRQRVTLQSPSGTRDAYGKRLTEWTDVRTVPARIEPLTVRETFLAAQLQDVATHRVTLRYCSEIAAINGTWRLLYGARIFVLAGPPRSLDEANREFELLCTESIRDE